MESSLQEVWEAAAGNPFVPTIGKSSQFLVGISLLIIGTLLAGFFGLNRSLINIPLVGFPASLAIGSHSDCTIRGSIKALAVSTTERFFWRIEIENTLVSELFKCRFLNNFTSDAGVFMMSNLLDSGNTPPIFKAVSSSARQLFQLLNCINFAPKVHVQITSEGIRFAVEDSRVMQGIAFLDKALFTSFNYNIPIPNEDAIDQSALEPPSFQISLVALLETLQIFGATEFSSRFMKPDDGYNTNIRPQRSNAFSNQTLGVTGMCRLSYSMLGSPFGIILEESGVVTTCNLNTYEPEAVEEIPFNREQLEVKIIMQSRYLFDAISEVSSIASSNSTTSNRLNITASPSSPFLSLSVTSALGSTSVEFARSRELLETFIVGRRWSQTYKFEMVKASAEAMRLASKVSFRSDQQGVLSLQFMVEVEGGGVSFVEFRFVPYLMEESDSETERENSDDIEY